MGELVDVDDLVGTTEIAELLGLSHTQNVHAWRKRHADFPEPLRQISGVWIWRWADIERWARDTGRLA